MLAVIYFSNRAPGSLKDYQTGFDSSTDICQDTVKLEKSCTGSDLLK